MMSLIKHVKNILFFTQLFSQATFIIVIFMRLIKLGLFTNCILFFLQKSSKMVLNNMKVS